MFIKKNVIKTLSKTAVVEENEISCASKLDQFNLDSLDMLEMIMALEEEFDLSIPSNMAEKVRTVGDIVDYIKNLTTEEKILKSCSLGA